MAKGDAKTKAAKKMLEAEESSPSKVSVGQIRAAEEEQGVGRRGMDTGKKKIPSDPIEHIRTLYGTGKPNDRVKKARKRLYDRYVEQGKLEPIFPTLVDDLVDGKKIPSELLERSKGLSRAERYARDADTGFLQAIGARDRYTKTGESMYDDQEIGQRKQSIPYIGEDLEDTVERRGRHLQDAHEAHQESRLPYVPQTDFWAKKETPEQREYTEELMAWRKKHGKKGRK